MTMPSCDNLSYMLFTLVGAVGKFSNKVARHFCMEHAGVDQMLNISEEGLCDLKNETSDMLWQVACLCKVMGWPLEEVAQMNQDKLSSRQESLTEAATIVKAVKNIEDMTKEELASKRKQWIYTPLIANEVIYLMLDEITEELTRIRFGRAKKPCRALKQIIAENRMRNEAILGREGAAEIKESATTFKDSLENDINATAFSYVQSIVKHDIDVKEGRADIAGLCYVARDFMTVIGEVEAECIGNIAKDMLTSCRKSDNERSILIKENLYLIIDSFSCLFPVKNQHTESCLAKFRNVLRNLSLS